MPAEVDIGRGDVTQRLVVAMIVVVFDKMGDFSFELPGVVLAPQRHQVFHGAVVALDLALCHRMIGNAADMPDALV